MALATAKPISWAAVQPASRMWYPDSEMALKRGASVAHQAIRSAASRSEGAGG